MPFNFWVMQDSLIFFIDTTVHTQQSFLRRKFIQCIFFSPWQVSFEEKKEELFERVYSLEYDFLFFFFFNRCFVEVLFIHSFAIR